MVYIIHFKIHKGVSVEGELGIIAGQEDDIINNFQEYPTIEQSLEFVERTKVDFFAPAVGTVHGFYNRKPNIHWDLIDQLIDIKTNLVLHGVTGINTQDLEKLKHLGYKKFNFATGVRSAFRDGIISHINNSGAVTKPQAYLKEGKEQVITYVKKLMKVCI